MININVPGAACAIMLSAVAIADPATLIVDRSGANGAYTSIQAAVDAAVAGDTILVKPGVYDNGYATYNYTDDASIVHTFTNRVTLTKKLYLKAEGSADETVILGSWDARTKTGIGSAAIRCVYVNQEAEGSVIEGFTLRDGNCHAQYKADGKTTIADVPANRGGGIASDRAGNAAFFTVGCIFDHCSGFRGGALRYGSAIRCRFINLEGSGACVGRDAAFVNCLIDGNKTNGGLLMGATLVNCTVVGNGGTGNVFSGTVNLYNSVCVGNNTYGAALGTTEASSTLSRSVVYDIQTSETPKKDFFKSVDHAVTGNDFVLFAPLFEDYRVLAGSDAEGLGDAEMIAEKLDVSSAAAPIDLYRDFSGAVIPRAGAINAGCLQATAVAAGGCAQFTDKVKAKGYAVKQENVSLWAHSEKAIDIFKVTVDGQPYYWETPEVRMPELDGGVYVGIPGAGVLTINKAVMPARTFTVGKSGGAQYSTIQAALDAVPDDKGTVILVESGDYDDIGNVNETDGNSCINLLHAVRVVGAGRGKSTIRGQKAETADGRGPGASRCVRFSQSRIIQIVQGFTLTEGRCNGSQTSDVPANSGGLALGLNTDNNYLLDCELSDGYAFRGSAAKFVTLQRCYVHDVEATSGAIVRPGRLLSSVLESSKGGSAACMVDVQQTYLHNCTLVSESPSLTVNSTSQSEIKGNYNSIYYSTAASRSALALGANTSGIVCSGNINYQIQPDTTPGYVVSDNIFVDVAHRDYRLVSSSDALTSGYSETGHYWEDLCLSDLNGNPRLFIDGKPLPGAVQSVIEAISIASDSNIDISPSGVIAVEPGESVTITATSKELQRIVVGFSVDGEKISEETASWTYTAPADGSWTLGGHTVAALLNSDWYVKPNGSDSANGWTPETAFATLTYAMSVSRAGDTVHALEGVYREGSAVGGGIDCRVVIKDGVSLVGDAGAEKTIIKGGEGVRPAAFAGAAGSLRDVTLTGGVLAKDSDTDAKRGGGVWANNRTVTVSDCIISNNVCARGGAARCCTLINCRIIGNEGAQTSGAAYDSTLYGCYMDKNTCGSGQLLRYLNGMYNCTLGAENPKAASVIADNRGTIENCAILCGSSSDAIANVRNCIVLESQKSRYGENSIKTIPDAAAAKLDEQGRPTKGSPLVDAGCALADGYPEADFFGTLWYYNGAPDIGAYEYDWRGDYRRDLGGGPISVWAADPQVVETASGKVLIRDGALELKLAENGVATRIKISVRVTGQGSLVVTRGETVVATLTASVGETELVLRRDDAPLSAPLTLAYEKSVGDGDDVGALLDGIEAARNGLCVVFK